MAVRGFWGEAKSFYRRGNHQQLYSLKSRRKKKYAWRMGGNAKTGIFLSPKCVKRFLATVRSFWSWAFRLSSSSRARLVWRTPTVTLQRKTNLFPSNATTYLMSWRFLWMLNDWSWGFRIAQMHLDWIRFACFRSFNFFRGADICKYFCNFLHALAQWCFIWFYLV